MTISAFPDTTELAPRQKAPDKKRRKRRRSTSSLSRELHRLDFDMPDADTFQALFEMASRILQVPACTISLAASHSEIFVAQRGLLWPPTPLELPCHSSFGTNVVEGGVATEGAIFQAQRFSSGETPTGNISNDTSNDTTGNWEKIFSYFAIESEGVRKSKARFYAGAPLLDLNGEVFGVFAVLGAEDRVLDVDEKATLAFLGSLAADKMNAIRLSQQLQQMRAKASITQSLMLAVVRNNIPIWAAVHHAASGIVISDPQQPDNPIVYANPAFLQTTGYEESEMLGRNCRMFQGVDTSVKSVSEVRCAVDSARSIRRTLLNYRKDGTPFWNDLIISPVHDVTGRLVSFVGILNDVSARIASEEALRCVREELEQRVLMRTADLGFTNDTLAHTNHALKKSNAELQSEMQRNLRSQAELEHSRLQLRALAAHLESVQDQERTRIAREIHDELGQLLTGMKMEIVSMQRRLQPLPDAVKPIKETPASKKSRVNALRTDALRTDASRPLDNMELHRRMSELVSQLDLSVLSVRRIAADMRPGILDRFGLCEAIRWQAQEFQRSAGIRCRCKIDDREVGRDHSNALFRIVQEALTNVARHASAKSVSIVFVEKDKNWVLKIKDDGVGMKDGTGSMSLGLVGMRERALLLGGELYLESRNSPSRSGTTVHVVLPMERRHNVAKPFANTSSQNDIEPRLDN